MSDLGLVEVPVHQTLGVPVGSHRPIRRVVVDLRQALTQTQARAVLARVAEPDIGYDDDGYDAVSGADVLLILTDWPQFAEVDYERVMAAMHSPCIVDARNLLDAAKLRKQGFSYRGIGIS